MSDLFSEALKDSKKLREVAEQDAKNRIIKELTPYIKEMIAKEVSTPSNFFLEQDEELVEPETKEQNQQATQDVAPEQPADVSVNPENLGDQQTTAPIAPSGEEEIEATLPDEDGKITVDFEDLFIDNGSITLDRSELDKLKANSDDEKTEQGASAAQPEGESSQEETPVENSNTGNAAQPAQQQMLPAQNESLSYDSYQREYANVSDRIDKMFFTESVSDISRETLKQRLFGLLDTVDKLKEAGLITGRQAKLQENKLEFLFIKLKEAGLHNSYSKENQNKDKVMNSLKEFAAKLFEEEENLAQDSDNTGESGLKVDEEYSEHAAEVSGVDPNLSDGEGFEGLEESPEDMFSECDDEDMSYEVDADELAEAVREIKKESIRNKMKKLREASDGEEEESWEDAEPEGGEDAALKNLEEGMEMGLYEEDEMMDDSLEDSEEDDQLVEESEDADLVLSVDLPPDIERELAKLGLEDDDLDVNVELNLDDLDSMDEDEVVEIVDDEEEGEESADEEGEESAPSSEEEMLLTDEEEVKESVYEARLRHAQRKNRILEKKIARAAKLLEQKEQELGELKKQLVETNLFTAKAVYYSKFLQRSLNEKALNKKVLQQIVEHLDRGKTVAETKAIYKKIEQKLNEHATASRKLDGSSSKVTRPGSANLTEGVAPQAGLNPDLQSPERWKLLAGIK